MPDTLPTGNVLILRLGLALVVGLIIGLERGWRHRDQPDEQSLAGMRTFSLLGLSGGVSALLSHYFGPALFIVALAAVALLVIAVRLRAEASGIELHTSTQLALVLTFLLGGLVLQPGHESVAAALAVVTAVLLSLKRHLQGWLKALSVDEMRAVLWLMVISVVALPLLPNQAFGPWGALNPYKLWWMVVLISGISFAGYFAMKLAGTERGILLTGLLGGLVSSTALTWHFSRLGRDSHLSPWLAAGVLVASGTMFFRVIAIVAALSPSLAWHLAPALVAAGLSVYLLAAQLWRRQRPGLGETGPVAGNPLNFGAALKFALLLTVVLLFTKAAHALYGDTGLYAVALISGLTDVDAITLSLSQMTGQGVPESVARIAIFLACAANSLFKGLLVLGIAGWRMGLAVLLPLLAALGAGTLVWGSLP